jgi:hypothetical protein
MKRAPGGVGITIWPKPFWPIISWCKSASSLKKSPALTTAQARQLVASIIDEEKNCPDILDVIDYCQRRNHAAYQSHRKRTLQRHQKRGSKPKK